jgi:uncharacterized membrane protein
MDLSVLNEWLTIAARWIHIFAGIMWVGQTYFFTWLDGRFTELVHAVEGASGKQDDRVWMVHSGGFYVVEKQKKPLLMPGKLHWFKWEAMITWVSGVTLLILVYYSGGLMVDENMDTTRPIIAGIAALVLSWPVYDLLWRFVRNEKMGIMISYILLVGLAYELTRIMGGRAAYIHVGAAMGLIMTANVWSRILPAQRKMVKALETGGTVDLKLAEQAKTRSKHNTFMAVPVVFIMISNHFPVTTYGNDWNWVVLAVMILVGWGAAKIIRKA